MFPCPSVHFALVTLAFDFTVNDGILILSVRVKGAGDYLPSYAGNLDIINCSAIKVVERLALEKALDALDDVHDSCP